MKKLKMKKGFTPTPTLALFRFFKILSLKIVMLFKKLILAKNDGETKKPRQSWCVGFTLIESLVAIAILLIAVVAPLSTIGGSFSSLLVARDQMIAVNFAQEGIEMVRQKRDSNMLNIWKNGVGSWGDNLSVGDYIVDATNLRGNGFLLVCNASCAVSDDRLIHQDQITGLFYQKIGALPAEDTQFTRMINIVDISTTEKKITSTVTWTIGGTLKKVEVKESIFGII